MYSKWQEQYFLWVVADPLHQRLCLYEIKQVTGALIKVILPLLATHLEGWQCWSVGQLTTLVQIKTSHYLLDGLSYFFYIYGPHRMNLGGDVLIFSPAPAGQSFLLIHLSQIDWHVPDELTQTFIQMFMFSHRMNPNSSGHPLTFPLCFYVWNISKAIGLIAVESATDVQCP